MEHKVPQYLNEQIRFLGLETDEMMSVLLAIYFNILFGFGWIFTPFTVAAAVLFIYINRQYPRGFMRHLFYFSGLYSFKGYPDFFQKEMNE